MNHFGKVLATVALLTSGVAGTFAQQPAHPVSAAQETPAGKHAETVDEAPSFPENAPLLHHEATPRLYHIRNVDIHGVKYLNPEILKSSAGLIAGDSLQQSKCPHRIHKSK